MKNTIKIASLFVVSLALFIGATTNVFAAKPSDYGLKEGYLISAIFSNDPDVYIINDQGYKRLFLNPEIFNFYGHLGGFANVHNVSVSTRDAFPTSGLFRNCETNDPKVYGLEVTGEDTGVMHWVNVSATQATTDDVDFFKKVFCINSEEFNWYKKDTAYSSVLQIPNYARGGTVNKRAVIIVYKNVYDSLRPDIDNFQNDVFANLGVKVDIIQLQDSLSYTPLDIRNLLIKECQPDGINGCANLEGAVLVGDIPYAWYAQPHDSGHQAPFMYFYEDLDASFKQNNVAHWYGYDGFGAYYGYDDYGAHEGPEIYTGWIRSTFSSADFNNHINELRAYFQKHHNFFAKQTVPSQWAVSAIHVPNNGYFSIPNLGLTVYGTENSIDIMPDIVDDLAPFKSALLAELSKGPEVAYLHSHGGPGIIWGLMASDFSNLANLPLFMLTWGCANGNFIEGTIGSAGSIVLAFIHGKNLGLSILSKLDGNDIDVYSGNCPNCGAFVNNQVNFFKYYNEGQYVGEAWLNVEHDFAAYKDPSGQSVGDLDLYKLSGPLQRIIIGSPFIYSPMARK